MLLAEEDYLYENYPIESNEIQETQKTIAKPVKKHSTLKYKLLCGLVFVLCSSFLLCQSIKIDEQHNYMTKLQSKLKDSTAELEQLKVDVATESEVVSIKDKAMNEYGMQVPLGSQIIKINQ